MVDSSFLDSLEISVVKVNPETNEIDENNTLNTKVLIALECGEPYYEKELNVILHSHNPLYDCAADTFENAIITLANLVYHNH